MGDHRASIKIEFTLHGVTSRADIGLNWWRGAYDDVPSSLRDFLREAESKSMTAYDDEQSAADDESQMRKRELRRQALEKLSPEERAAFDD